MQNMLVPLSSSWRRRRWKVVGNQCQREKACLHWTGATTEKRQVSLGINEPAGEKAGRGEDHERSSEFQKEQKDIWRL